jgi:hypothetical protein
MKAPSLAMPERERARFGLIFIYKHFLLNLANVARTCIAILAAIDAPPAVIHANYVARRDPSTISRAGIRQSKFLPR